MQKQFAVGVNDVTRVLERMPSRERRVDGAEDGIKRALRRAPLVPLQVVDLVVYD